MIATDVDAKKLADLTQAKCLASMRSTAAVNSLAADIERDIGD